MLVQHLLTDALETIIYRANIAHPKVVTYGLFQEFEIFTKFNKYGLYSTPIAL